MDWVHRLWKQFRVLLVMTTRAAMRALVFAVLLYLVLLAVVPIWIALVMASEVLMGGWAVFLDRPGLYQTLLTGIGTTAALAGVCFGYSRASEEATWDRRVGFDCGRLFLASSSSLFLVLVSEFARRDFLVESMSRFPAWLDAAIGFGSALATGVAAILGALLGGVALVWLYIGGIRLIWTAITAGAVDAPIKGKDA